MVPFFKKHIFILVHGAWHGRWCWYKITTLLQKGGHSVISVNLPGHNDPTVSPEKTDFTGIGLQSYVDALQKIIQEQPHPVILVGHSMAGVVISQVAENIPDFIHCLIYISAFIPFNGKCLMDEEKQAMIPSVALHVTVNTRDNALYLPFSNHSILDSLFYGCTAALDKQYAYARLQPQPLRPFTDPVILSDHSFGQVPKIYIECLKDNAVMIHDQRRMHGRIQCAVATLDTDHSPFFSSAEQLVHVIHSKINTL